jgi:hypothetical protein
LTHVHTNIIRLSRQRSRLKLLFDQSMAVRGQIPRNCSLSTRRIQRSWCMVPAKWLERQGLLKIIPCHAPLWRTRTDGIREAAGTRQSAIVLHTLAYHLGFLRNLCTFSCRTRQSMASPPPAYETTTSPDASSVDTNQKTTHPWPTPTALLPRYSTSSPSCWMKEKGLEILRTSHDFDAVILICKFVPGLEPAVAAIELSKRRAGWLGAFLKVLCRREGIQEPSCDSPLSRANAIVGIIRRRPLSPAPKLDGARILSALHSSGDVSVIAEQLDAQVHSVFSRIIPRDWLEWYCGFANDPIQSLLNAGLNLRNDLARSVQKHAKMVERLQSLQEARFYLCTRYITNIENRYCHLDTLYHIG